MSSALTIAAIAGLLIIALVVFLYRRGRLKEDHALLWTAVSIAIVILSTWNDLLVTIDQAVGAAKASDVVFAAFVAFLMVVSIYYSVKISELSEQNRKIAQELTVLKTVNLGMSQTPQEKGR